tara:strand:+ start:647 stop:874 length:228 start_codon:yes stop_codon:yes gene_type:complete
MANKNEITLERDGVKFVWRNAGDEVEVDAFKDGKCVMEWGYPKVVGRGFRSNITHWMDQAEVQAKAEMDKSDTPA